MPVVGARYWGDGGEAGCQVVAGQPGRTLQLTPVIVSYTRSELPVSPHPGVTLGVYEYFVLFAKSSIGTSTGIRQ